MKFSSSWSLAGAKKDVKNNIFASKKEKDPELKDDSFEVEMNGELTLDVSVEELKAIWEENRTKEKEFDINKTIANAKEYLRYLTSETKQTGLEMVDAYYCIKDAVEKHEAEEEKDESKK